MGIITITRIHIGRLRCSIFGRHLAAEFHPGKVGAGTSERLSLTVFFSSSILYEELGLVCSPRVSGFQQSRGKVALTFMTRKLFTRDSVIRSFASLVQGKVAMIPMNLIPPEAFPLLQEIVLRRAGVQLGGFHLVQQCDECALNGT